MRVRIEVQRSGSPSLTSEEAPARFPTGPGPDADVVRLGIDFDPVDPSDLRLFHKTVDRSLYDQRIQRHREWDDVLLTNERGMVTESTIANLAVSIAGQWVTPPMSDGLLPGIMRAHLLESGRLVERSVSVRDVVEAPALAVFNSIRGWVPATLATSGVGASQGDR
jgi:para-aminobenzoate synthetase/4-amino-4-deoxychorismate lyase